MKKILLSLFDHQTLALLRWDLKLLGVRARNVLLARRRKLNALVRKRTRPLFLNLGAGPRGKEDGHWINVDAARYPSVHYLADFNRPLPFAVGTFDGIYSEHVLEHFTLEQGASLLRECLRILKQGGCIRLVVPDGAAIIEWYSHDPAKLLRNRPGEWDSPMGAVNSYFRQRYEHRLIYDLELLTALLAKLGYERAGRVSFRIGSVAEMSAMDDVKYEQESLYVEAFAPGCGGDR